MAAPRCAAPTAGWTITRSSAVGSRQLGVECSNERRFCVANDDRSVSGLPRQPREMTTLGPTPADELGLLDLATVELDVATLAQGYIRPAGLAFPSARECTREPRESSAAGSR